MFEIGSDGGSSAKVQVGDLGRMREATKLFWYEQNERLDASLSWDWSRFAAWCLIELIGSNGSPWFDLLQPFSIPYSRSF